MMKYNTKEYLAMCFALNDTFGYIPNSKANKEDTTWYNARALYLYTHYEPVDNFEFYEKLALKVDAASGNHYLNSLDAIAWLKFEYEGKNEYLLKVKAVVEKLELEDRDLPLVASLPKVWNREKDLLHNTSEFIGRVGETLKVEVTEYKLAGSYFSQFGDVNVYQFKDKYGNIFIWKTAIDINDKPNYIEGKIKEHSEWKGVKQTVLTRCKIS